MKTVNFEELGDEDIVKAFAKWAEIEGEATFDGDMPKARRALSCLKELDRILRARGPQVRSLLLPFLANSHEGVRYYVAHQLLGIAPESARAVMTALASGVGPIAGAAGMTLSALDQGTLKPT